MVSIFLVIFSLLLWNQNNFSTPLSTADLEFIGRLSIQNHRFSVRTQSVEGIPVLIEQLNTRLRGQTPDIHGLLTVTFSAGSIVYQNDGVTCDTLTFSKLAEGLGGNSAPQPWTYQDGPLSSAPFSISELQAIGARTAGDWKAAQSNESFTQGTNGADSFLASFVAQINRSIGWNVNPGDPISLYFDPTALTQAANLDYYASTLTQIITALDSGMLIHATPPVINQII